MFWNDLSREFESSRIREFKNFDSSTITTRARSLDPLSGTSRIVNYEFDSTTRAFLEKVVSFYSQLRASDLVKLSHAEGGPWDETWNHSGVVNPGMKIKEDSIVSFYSHAFVPFSLEGEGPRSGDEGSSSVIQVKFEEAVQ